MMTLRMRMITAFTLAVAATLLIAAPALAYIDPGTTNAVFTNLTPILLMVGSAIIAVALWPFRMLYRWARPLPWFAQVGVYLGAVCVLAGVCAGAVYLLFIA